jgi:pimeloyl-ACP methyl ester carboxylesterase
MAKVSGSRETVVLVHGIWMNGLELLWLGRRLAACGFDPRYLHYHSVLGTPQANADRLAAYIRRLGLKQVHLVAHSLGGIVVMHLLDRHRGLPAGRVVLLGSPVRGSGVARVLAGRKLLRPLLGRSLRGLVDGVSPWSGAQALGVIAGTRGIGLGLLFGGLSGVNDGVVSLAETHLDGADDFVTVAASHTGLIFSAEVAGKVCSFLRSGRFGGGGAQAAEASKT